MTSLWVASAALAATSLSTSFHGSTTPGWPDLGDAAHSGAFYPKLLDFQNATIALREGDSATVDIHFEGDCTECSSAPASISPKDYAATLRVHFPNFESLPVAAVGRMAYDITEETYSSECDIEAVSLEWRNTWEQRGYSCQRWLYQPDPLDDCQRVQVTCLKGKTATVYDTSVVTENGISPVGAS